jgi:hypothetical protein
MTDLQICYCGAFAGYPHAEDCPRPLFHAVPNSPAEDRWYEDRAKLQAPPADRDLEARERQAEMEEREDRP